MSALLRIPGSDYSPSRGGDRILDHLLSKAMLPVNLNKEHQDVEEKSSPP